MAPIYPIDATNYAMYAMYYIARAQQACADAMIAEARTIIHVTGSVTSTPEATRDAIVAGLKLPRVPLPVHRGPRTDAAVIDALNPHRKTRR